MSNDLVVQLGAKLDQFASDMNTAGDMADSAREIEVTPARLRLGPLFSDGGIVGLRILMLRLSRYFWRCRSF